MMKWIETTGKNEEEAIQKALRELGLDRDEVSVEILERAKSGDVYKRQTLGSSGKSSGSVARILKWLMPQEMWTI